LVRGAGRKAAYRYRLEVIGGKDGRRSFTSKLFPGAGNRGGSDEEKLTGADQRAAGTGAGCDYEEKEEKGGGDNSPTHMFIKRRSSPEPQCR